VLAIAALLYGSQRESLLYLPSESQHWWTCLIRWQ